MEKFEMIQITEQLHELAVKTAKKMKTNEESAAVLRDGLAIAVSDSTEGKEVQIDFDNGDAVIYSHLDVDGVDHVIYATNKKA